MFVEKQQKKHPFLQPHPAFFYIIRTQEITATSTSITQRVTQTNSCEPPKNRTKPYHPLNQLSVCSICQTNPKVPYIGYT